MIFMKDNFILPQDVLFMRRDELNEKDNVLDFYSKIMIKKFREELL